MTKFLSNHYLAVTFVVSLALGMGGAVWLYDSTKEAPQALSFVVIVVALGLLLAAPRLVSSKLNSIMRSAVAGLGGPNDTSDQDFKKRIGSVFGSELISNIFAYEGYCRNEYLQDMKKHHLAWVMVAAAGAITIIAAVFALFSGNADDLQWIKAIGVTLPALVTGVLLKIWLETRENLNRTRERIDLIYRQRLRLLLLVADHVDISEVGWLDSIELNGKLLNYINAPEDAQHLQSVVT